MPHLACGITWAASRWLSFLPLRFTARPFAVRSCSIDRGLPFFLPGWADMPLSAWLTGVRPLLMLTYWINFQIGQTDAYWYHVFNVVFHLGNAVLIGLIVRRILEWAGVDQSQRRVLALFSGALFFVHPMQTDLLDDIMC